jgi:stigma-specific protein Stig1
MVTVVRSEALLDRSRLDALSRTLARSHSRRGALRLAAAALVGVGAITTTDVTEARHKHKRCKAPTQTHCIGKRCVHLLTDPGNCGSCLHICGASLDRCINGMCCTASRSPICVCAPTGSACNAHTCCANGPCANGLCP